MVCTHRVLYWSRDEADRNPAGILREFASSQLSPERVGIGDIVWVITVRGGRVYLLGRIEVGAIRAREPGRRQKGRDREKPKRRYQIVSRPGREQRKKNIDLGTRIEWLAFARDDLPSFDISTRTARQWDFREMLVPTENSAGRLQDAWDEAPPVDPPAQVGLFE